MLHYSVFYSTVQGRRGSERSNSFSRSLLMEVASNSTFAIVQNLDSGMEYAFEITATMEIAGTHKI